MSLAPDVIERLQNAAMKRSAIDTDAIEAFERGEFVPLTLDKWITKQKAERPHCFIGGDQFDLESAAFASGNVTARSRLVTQIGEAGAAERAIEWGLKGLHDYKTRGKRPGGPEQHEKPKAENPWSAEGWNLTRQGAVAKADLALAQRLAKAAGSYLGATRPNKAA